MAVKENEVLCQEMSRGEGGRDGPLEEGWNLNSFSEVPAPTSKSYLRFLHGKCFT